MGYIGKLHCQCGYEKTMHLGGGMSLPDAEEIKGSFSAEKLEEFNQALNAGSLGKVFYLENVMMCCKECKDIVEGKILHYQIKGQDKAVLDYCGRCGNEGVQVEENVSCPQCGKKLNISNEGLWD